MPFAWASVFTELAYPALRLAETLKTRSVAWASVWATLVISVSAGIMVGFYEYFAFRAGWWKYEPARFMIGPYCAAFIPVGEALMFLPVLLLARRALAQDRPPVQAAIESGTGFAISIAVGYAIAYGVLEAFSG